MRCRFRGLDLSARPREATSACVLRHVGDRAETGVPGIDRHRLTAPREDTELIIDAMSYVDAVHMDLAAENTAPAPGVAGRVVGAILADPSLSDYVRTWARQQRAMEASGGVSQRPPWDASYERVRELLRRAGDTRRR